MFIRYLANPASPHVRQWALLLNKDDRLIIYHIPLSDLHLVHGENIETISPLPNWMIAFPKVINYVILGLYIRFMVGGSVFIHAHNTSGYGLSARVSGKKYGITTYGSEIFSMPKKSKTYGWLIKFVLNKAKFITSTSEAMNASLVKYCNCESNDITCFSLGVDACFYNQNSRANRSSNKNWIVNRRIHPMYETHKLIDAFKSFLNAGGEGCLYLLQGQADYSYLNEIKAQIEGIQQILLVEEFLSTKDMSDLLNKMDFAISIPISDQLSSAILEAAICGTIPILRKLDTYKNLDNIAIVINNDSAFDLNLKNMFKSTSIMNWEDQNKLSSLGSKFVGKNYSEKAAKNIYMSLLERENILFFK